MSNFLHQNKNQKEKQAAEAIRRKKNLIAGIGSALLICGLLLWIVISRDPTKELPVESQPISTQQTEDADLTDPDNTDQTMTSSPTNPDGSHTDTSDPSQTTDATQSETGVTTTSPVEIHTGESDPTTPVTQKPVVNVEDDENHGFVDDDDEIPVVGIELPYTIPGSEVSVDYINGYSGVFIEDHSDRDVSHVAAIKITNHSDIPLEYGTIVLMSGDTEWRFDASAIPGKSTAIIMEKTGAIFDKSQPIQCKDGQFGFAETQWSMSADSVIVEETGSGGISLENISEEDIPCVRVFYRYKASTGDYIGGIAYVSKIVDLKAGEYRVVYPSHFEKNGSEILHVRMYETAD